MAEPGGLAAYADRGEIQVMWRRTRVLAPAATAALLFGACSSDGGDAADGSDGSDGMGIEQMMSWDACDVLGDLQPIVDFMGIENWTATVSGQNRPDSTPWGESGRIPDALVCGGSFDLPSVENMPISGGLVVGLTPIDDDGDPPAVYDAHVTSVGQLGSDPQTQTETQIGAPWDAGTLITQVDASDRVHAVALDGQWLVHLQLNYTADYAAQRGQQPDYQFARADLHQWLVNNYLAEVNRTVNEMLADNGSDAGASGGGTPIDQAQPPATEDGEGGSPGGASAPAGDAPGDGSELGPATPPPAGQTADPRAAQGCFEGEMSSCDFMSIASDPATASYGATCGARLTDEIPGECESRYGSMVG